jgi:hypothetical protein
MFLGRRGRRESAPRQVTAPSPMLRLLGGRARIREGARRQPGGLRPGRTESGCSRRVVASFPRTDPSDPHGCRSVPTSRPPRPHVRVSPQTRGEHIHRVLFRSAASIVERCVTRSTGSPRRDRPELLGSGSTAGARVSARPTGTGPEQVSCPLVDRTAPPLSGRGRCGRRGPRSGHD